MIALTKPQRARLIVAHRIDAARNVVRVDFKPKPEPVPLSWSEIAVRVGTLFLLSIILAALAVAEDRENAVQIFLSIAAVAGALGLLGFLVRRWPS